MSLIELMDMIKRFFALALACRSAEIRATLPRDAIRPPNGRTRTIQRRRSWNQKPRSGDRGFDRNSEALSEYATRKGLTYFGVGAV
jgi:hypothetical protein